MTEQVLLALKAGFLVLLFLFIWRIIRVAQRDLRSPQESMIIGAAAAEAAGLGRAAPAAPPPEVGGPHLLVLSSPIYPPGTIVRLDQDVTFGRSDACDIILEGDAYASSRHAAVFVRNGGRYVRDLGSTNGTHVDGQQIVAEHRLHPGDEVRVGETELRYEE